MRGEFEYKLDADLVPNYSQTAVNERLKADPPETEEAIFSTLKTDVADSVNRGSTELAEAWQECEKPESVVVPTKKRTSADPDSIARGRALFLSAKAKCVTCHGVTGKGDGANTEVPQAGKDVPGLFDDWGRKIKPRDLTTGIYRGGRRPIDLYRRIRAGIKGTPMPPFDANLLSDEEVWDLVNYVLNVPHEQNGTSISEKPKTAAPAEEHAATK
jgi:mono/diheme cytochrome c family protein